MKRSLSCVGIVLAAAVIAAPLHAQGSAVQTHSSCATAMGSAGVAAPCADGSAVLFNPAALAMQPSVLGIGSTWITSSGDFTFDFTGETVERAEETRPVPFGFVSYRPTERLAVALGGFAPYGLGIVWPEDESFPGRFVSYDTELRNIYIQPTAAYQVTPWLSFGAGVDVVLASIEINQRLDLASIPLPAAQQPIPNRVLTFGDFGIPLGTEFADANLAGDGVGVTFHLGAVARVSEALSLGVRYLHEAEIDYDGDAAFEPVSTGLVLPGGAGFPLNPTEQDLPVDALVAGQFNTGGALGAQEISTSLTLPRQLVVGAAVYPFERLKILGDYQFTGWESFDAAQVDFANQEQDTPLILDYQNTHTLRAGAEFRPIQPLALRAGFIYNTAAENPASVSPLLPEAERNYYSAGIGYRLPMGLGIDVGYQYIDQSDRRGRVVGRTSFAQTAQQLNQGVYTADASLFNVTLSYQFGGMMR